MADIPPPLQPANILVPGNVVPGNNLQIVPRPKTFTQFYDDASKDPCERNYARVMQRFDPENVNAPAADVLFTQAVGTSGNLHRAYLCCAPTRRGPRIYCIHLPSRFVSALDGHTTAG